MCNDPIVQAALIVAGAALAVIAAIVVARIDAWCDTRRKQLALVKALQRLEQAQHFWRPSPDIERREA